MKIVQPMKLTRAIPSLFAGALGVACPAGPALSIVANPPPRICAAYSKADAVVAGRVVSERVTDKWDIWRISVDRTYKGRVPVRFNLYSENDSARATPDVGRRNVLFLHRERGRWIGWGSDPDTGGDAFAGIERAVRLLSRARPRPTASVIGLVATDQDRPGAGLSIILRERLTGASRHAVTDSNGRFVLQLPPGRWSAKVSEPGWTSRDSIYSYDNPDAFVAKAGGCNDLRLEPIRPGGPR